MERDLTPLILSNCQYRVELGKENLQEFDLEKIQRQVTSRFLQGKPRLTLRGIPTLVYRRDWDYEHLFTGIRNKMAQVSVSSLLRVRLTRAGPFARAALVPSVSVLSPRLLGPGDMAVCAGAESGELVCVCVACACMYVCGVCVCGMCVLGL